LSAVLLSHDGAYAQPCVADSAHLQKSNVRRTFIKVVCSRSTFIREQSNTVSVVVATRDAVVELRNGGKFQCWLNTSSEYSWWYSSCNRSCTFIGLRSSTFS